MSENNPRDNCARPPPAGQHNEASQLIWGGEVFDAQPIPELPTPICAADYFPVRAARGRGIGRNFSCP